MDDLELFNLVRENYHKVNKDYIREQIRIASSYLDEVVEMGEWIPVSERLPEEYEDVLVTVLCGNDKQKRVILIGFGYASKPFNRWMWRYYNIHHSCEFEVLAWMPLPEPYRGK